MAGAVKSLPPQFNFQPPPDIEAIKRNVNEYESGKRQSAATTENQEVTFKSPAKSEYKCVSGSTIGRAGPAVMTTGGCGNYAVPSPDVSVEYSITKNKITSYSLIELQPLQFDYVKGSGGKLVCFVNYQTIIGIFNRTADAPLWSARVDEPKPDQDLGARVGQYSARETARYDFENGAWIFKAAGLKELERMKEIDKVRIEARIKTPQ